jgi:hypothetical protein
VPRQVQVIARDFADGRIVESQIDGLNAATNPVR